MQPGLRFGVSMHIDQAVRYVSEQQVLSLLDPDRLIVAVREALTDLSAGRVRQPLRSVMGFDESAPGLSRLPEAPGPVAREHGMLFMKPAQVGDALATKLITWVPGNAERGLPSLCAIVVLFDSATGRPLAVIEASHLTAMRTAAATAVAAHALARPDAAIVAMLGSGVLARSHARFLRRVRSIREIRIWSRDAENVRRCAEEVGGVACESAEAAVRGADIVCTVSNASEPILRGEWLRRGCFVAAVGAPRPTWRELDDLAMSHPVIADQREAAESESGDVIGSGAKVFAEIGDILSGRVAPPQPGETVIFKSLGLAVEDAVAARLVYESLR
jgi:ornithine cyclodeaminase/alanine dehydrogenase-like protein (mu-crystallin family)